MKTPEYSELLHIAQLAKTYVMTCDLRDEEKLRLEIEKFTIPIADIILDAKGRSIEKDCSS